MVLGVARRVAVERRVLVVLVDLGDVLVAPTDIGEAQTRHATLGLHRAAVAETGALGGRIQQRRQTLGVGDLTGGDLVAHRVVEQTAADRLVGPGAPRLVVDVVVERPEQADRAGERETGRERHRPIPDRE